MSPEKKIQKICNYNPSSTLVYGYLRNSTYFYCFGKDVIGLILGIFIKMKYAKMIA